MTFTDDMITILEAMTWTNYGQCPDLERYKIKNKKADPHEKLIIIPGIVDTDEYQSIDGVIHAEVQTGTLRLKSQYQTKVQAMEDDLIAELPGQGCSIISIDRPEQKNKYEWNLVIERLN